MRNAIEEAKARLDGVFDVRVLEPSPPAVSEPPWFADDPVAGGEVVPIERQGSRSWASVCDERNDAALWAWCQERWLVRAPLPALPDGFGATRLALHAVAEHVLARARWEASGKIGLRFTLHGFGTPFFGADRQVRIEDGSLVLDDPSAGEGPIALTSLRAAGESVGVKPGAPDVFSPTTHLDLDTPLDVDAGAARALGDWFGFGASLLEQLRADATEDDAPGRVQIWPEHFDVAVDLGPHDARANYGASPGDAEHPEPYLYVGPWEPISGAFWNEPWGASLSYPAILDGADALAFLRRGKALLAS